MTSLALALLALAPLGSLALTAAPAPLERARTLAAELRALPPDAAPGDLAAGAAERLPPLRHALLDAALPELGAPAAEANARLRAALTSAGLLHTSELGALGWVSSLAIEEVPGWAELRAVRVALEVPAGADEAVFLFARRGGAWRPAVALEAARLRSGHDLRENLVYAVSPPDARGGWFVAAAWGVPWPTSCWNTLHFAALRPGAEGGPPGVLGGSERSVYRCGEPPFRIAAAADRFGLAWWGEHEAHAAGGARVHLERFRVEGGKLRLEPPVAVGPAELVSEWVAQPWERAKLLSSAEPTLEALHRQLSPEVGRRAYLELGELRGCPGGQVLLRADETAVEGRGYNRSFYFRVESRPGGRVLGAMPRAPGDCAGPPQAAGAAPPAADALPDPLR